MKNKIYYNIKYKFLLWKQLRETLYIFSIKEHKYKKFIKNIEKINSIRQYLLFSKKIQPMLYSKKLQQGKTVTEAEHYGHYDALLHYAGDPFYKLVLIPGLEHGVSFIGGRYLENVICYAYQGENHLTEIHNVNPYKPAFVLGPYIHYAQYYYSKKQFDEIKKKLGKVLLVFPSHTYEETNIERRDDFVNRIYEKYTENFDTVMVCVYWHDVNDPVMKEFEKRGAKLVSAGFRGDKNFISRLKTIIEFSDAAVLDGIGTNLGYCLYMRKPVYMEDWQQSIYIKQNREIDRDEQQKIKLKFYSAFHTDNLLFTEEQKKLQMELYETYWGGEKYIKTKEEMRLIFELLEEVYKAAHYDTRKVPKAIQCKLKEWKMSDIEEEQKKYRLLKEAIKE